MKLATCISLIFLVNICIAEDESMLVNTSFEEFKSGEFTRLSSSYGTWEAPLHHAEIDARHSRSKSNCLHILGGTEHMVDFVPSKRNQEFYQLSFWAERWTSRNPFMFRVQIFNQNKWQEIYNGDKEIKVGRGFLSYVTIDLPKVEIKKIRFLCTAPEIAGVLIDDFRISKPSKMVFESITTDQWITPVLIRNEDNPVLQIKVAVKGNLEPLTISELTINTTGTDNVQDIAAVRIYYSGTREEFIREKQFGKTERPTTKLIFSDKQQLQQGTNYFWISYQLKDVARLSRRVDAGCEAIHFTDGQLYRPEMISPPIRKRIGIALRKGGDDGSKVYRIPGLATTKKGTLIAVYDIRYNGGGDLPNRIDVGMSRSTNGGQTWEPMKTIMDMGSDPKWRGDGIGDPSILIDQQTNVVWVAALWSHGNRGWHGSGPGITSEETGQLMMATSEDDGKTWSKPINITRQIKKPEWTLLLQGPGKGINMKDGTLVFPAQFQDKKRMPHSTIIYSKNHGKTWNIGTGVKPNTTEAQVVELNDGSLMLNMRDNRGGARSVYITKDLGQTWTMHPTSRKALPEPVCMASLIRSHSMMGGAYRNLLIFSNPNSIRGRHHMTIKISEDEGMTWPNKYQLLLDERKGAGYSCMTVIDKNHIGILYEGSQAHLVFEKIHLSEIMGK